MTVASNGLQQSGAPWRPGVVEMQDQTGTTKIERKVRWTERRTGMRGKEHKGETRDAESGVQGRDRVKARRGESAGERA